MTSPVISDLEAAKVSKNRYIKMLHTHIVSKMTITDEDGTTWNCDTTRFAEADKATFRMRKVTDESYRKFD